MPHKDTKAVTLGLKQIHSAPTLDSTQAALDELSKKSDAKYPLVSRYRRNNQENIIPLFQFSEDIRKVIYIANAIELRNRAVRKVIKNRKIFPNNIYTFKIRIFNHSEGISQVDGIY